MGLDGVTASQRKLASKQRTFANILWRYFPAFFNPSPLQWVLQEGPSLVTDQLATASPICS